ncbi:class II histone deacetylase [Rhodococcus sp. MEB064]|uniref:class II histone deacetylase n=1 Tax=Rhodococcus sp. MEB064 TaxID=1587522 RepID=UPI0005ABC058|nr:class II histone deacetylase [Rhodococcus sp. MEB064]KIQ18452.1 acetoin utilization protein [Rhodococcus sp. MEB064]
MTTGYIWHELYGWSDTGSGGLFPADAGVGLQPISHHVAHPDTKRRIHELIVVSGLVDSLDRLTPRHATEAELLRVHTREHVDRIRHESTQAKGGDAGDGISPFGKGGYEIATLAAGGVIEMVDAVVSGKVDNGYALVHPCGHHAPSNTGMGFCMFNNGAVAVAHAREVMGVEKIAIIDWDVHHGNGAQAIFASDPSVLTVSVHQDRCFPPNSGFLTERGEGAGFGYNINAPLPPGTGDDGYLYAIDTVVVPALRAFAPDLIVIASGMDPNAMDPLARMLVTSRGFRAMTERVLAVANEVCEGKVVVVQEGGYSPLYVPFCALACVEALAGVESREDPYYVVVGGFGGKELQPHQKEAIDAAAALVAEI